MTLRTGLVFLALWFVPPFAMGLPSFGITVWLVAAPLIMLSLLAKGANVR